MKRMRALIVVAVVAVVAVVLPMGGCNAAFWEGFSNEWANQNPSRQYGSEAYWLQRQTKIMEDKAFYEKYGY